MTNSHLFKLEQIERLHSGDTPRRHMVTHTIESYWITKQDKVKVTKLKNLPKMQILEFLNKFYTWHTS